MPGMLQEVFARIGAGTAVPFAVVFSDGSEYRSGDAAPAWTMRFKTASAERLTDKGVVRAIKNAAQRAGLDPAIYAGHSARRGGITSALRAGSAERDTNRMGAYLSHRLFSF